MLFCYLYNMISNFIHGLLIRITCTMAKLRQFWTLTQLQCGAKIQESSWPLLWLVRQWAADKQKWCLVISLFWFLEKTGRDSSRFIQRPADRLQISKLTFKFSEGRRENVPPIIQWLQRPKLRSNFNDKGQCWGWIAGNTMFYYVFFFFWQVIQV